MAGGFLHLNRNKRSIVLDLKLRPQRLSLQKLIATADVFVHSLRPKAINKLGLGYDAVRALKCRHHLLRRLRLWRGLLTATRPPMMISSRLGPVLQHCTFPPAASRPSCRTVLCDKLSGQAIAYSVIAALFQRERGGGGQAIEVPMFETTAEFAYHRTPARLRVRPPLGPTGYVRVVSPRRKPFRNADGYMCILPYSDHNWRDFFEFIGRPDLKTDARFYPLTERVAHLETLYEMIEAERRTVPTADWVDLLRR